MAKKKIVKKKKPRSASSLGAKDHRVKMQNSSLPETKSASEATPAEALPIGYSGWYIVLGFALGLILGILV